MNPRPNYPAEIFTKYYNVINDYPKYIQECLVQVRLPY